MLLIQFKHSTNRYIMHWFMNCSIQLTPAEDGTGKLPWLTITTDTVKFLFVMITICMDKIDKKNTSPIIYKRDYFSATHDQQASSNRCDGNQVNTIALSTALKTNVRKNAHWINKKKFSPVAIFSYKECYRSLLKNLFNQKMIC